MTPIVACDFAAALSDIVAPDDGDDAPSNAPMPEPPPSTNRLPLPIIINPLLGKALRAGDQTVPPLIVVPPVYVFVPLRITSPPPLMVNDSLPLVSRIEPAMVNTLPGEAVTLRLLPIVIGALIVWLPPLLLIVAVPGDGL